MSNDKNFQGGGAGAADTAAGPLTLALDTATERRSVAVMRGAGVLAERASDLRESGAASVLAEVDAALKDAGLRVRDVELFAAAAGPGSFTGLRSGIATLKALSHTLRRPAAGVPTLHAVAYGARPAGRLVALIPAGRGEVFAQFLSVNAAGEVGELSPPAHVSPARLLERAVAAGGALRWVGGGALKYLGLIKEAARAHGFAFVEADDGRADAGDAWQYVPVPDALARGVGLLAQARLRRGESPGADDLRPLYVRPSDAELHEQCQARG
ncbi:MAG TPA: tRNA (adenosine(37)-N6)-threonylcarbamoyltransferase complex dimerization subunit type 1 TsaB [Pyrinomonadaceae bacterium]|nr:tRNA (adenosine(37)-N6)-threonylcarbamoyltransferase complex dimerization subunit type 1 TsaB [Pyrinomonadaceae bacterium]